MVKERLSNQESLRSLCDQLYEFFRIVLQQIRMLQPPLEKGDSEHFSAFFQIPGQYLSLNNFRYKHDMLAKLIHLLVLLLLLVQLGNLHLEQDFLPVVEQHIKLPIFVN